MSKTDFIQSLNIDVVFLWPIVPFIHPDGFGVNFSVLMAAVKTDFCFVFKWTKKTKCDLKKKPTNTQQKCLIPRITDSEIHINIFVYDMSFTHPGHVIACVTRRKRDDWETWETQMTLRPQQTHPWQQEADSVRVSCCVSVRKRIKEQKKPFHCC